MAGGNVGMEKVPEVTGEMEQLSREVEFLTQQWIEMEKRITNILRPVPPKSEEGKKESNQPACRLASNIQEMGLKVRAIGENIRESIDRVEL